MAIYILIFLLLAFVSVVDLRKGRNNTYSIISVFIICVVIFFFAGFRYEVGSDYMGYLDIFQRVLSGESVNVEIGFTFLIEMFSFLSNNYVIFIILFFATSFFLKIYSIAKLTPFISFSLTIYFSSVLLSSDVNQLRMGLSFGIILLAIVFLLNQQAFKFYFAVILACTIHYSSIVFLPAYILTKFKFNLKSYIIILGISLLNFYYFKYFVIDDLGFDFLFFLNEGFLNKYSAYTGIDNEFESVFTLISRIFLCLTFYLYNRKFPNDRNEKLVTLYFFSIIIYLILTKQGLIASRLSGYYKIVEIIFIPYLFHYFKNFTVNIFIYIFLVCFLGIQLYRILLVPGNLFPYDNLIFNI